MTVLCHTAGTFQSQDLNSNGQRGILYLAFPQELAVWPWPQVLRCTRDIQPAGLFCFLQFFADLWAAVVGKYQVINNSYTNAEAAEREMPLGNGLSDKYRFHNSTISHNTISLFWVYGKLVIINVGEVYLCLDIWPRDKRGLKMKPFYCYLEWDKWTIGKRGTMGLIYKKKKKNTCISSLPGQLRYCDTLLQFIIPRFQEAWSQLTQNVH